MKVFMKSNFIANGYLTADKKEEDSFFSTHSHDFFELEYIISGSGTYTVDGITYDIKEGDLFFLTPLNFHCVDIHKTQLYNVMFSGNICNSTFLQELTYNSPIILRTEDETKSYFQSLLNDLCCNTDDMEYSVTILNAIIAKLEKESSNNVHQKKSSVINRAELYMITNFKNQLTLNDIANEVALAPTYFSKIFKAETGVNFKTYLNNTRFEYAKKLLIYSDMTVMQICVECGFNDYPNFIRRFKQHTGYYPIEYRKNKWRT